MFLVETLKSRERIRGTAKQTASRRRPLEVPLGSRSHLGDAREDEAKAEAEVEKEEKERQKEGGRGREEETSRRALEASQFFSGIY